MKALTNILTRLLMLMLLMLVACTEEPAEVDNLMREEQYVTVRMNIPGMTVAATRADDGVIESITALAFNTNKELLEVDAITTVTNTNANGGFNGTFNLTVPNGTTTIHFLANLPDDAKSQLPAEMGGSEVDVMTSITTTDYIHQLSYWGKADYNGTSDISTTLYRHKAMIAIEPSQTDKDFNQFTIDDLSMTGLQNTNEKGTLVPYNEGFNFDLNSKDYITLPNGLTSNNYGLSFFKTVYVFEHENTLSNPLYIICKIGDYHYKVALVDDEGNPYPIIRNHKYTIYVSDVDDYQTENYQAIDYETALTKDPINLDVEVIKPAITASADKTTLYYDTDNQTTTVTVNIPEGVQTLNITAEDFTVALESGNGNLNGNTYTLNDTNGQTAVFVFTMNNVSSTSNQTSTTIAFSDNSDVATSPNPITITLTEKPEVTRYTVWTGDANIKTLEVQLDDYLSVIEESVGRKLCYEYYMIQDGGGWWKIDCYTGYYVALSGTATTFSYTAEKNQVYFFELTQNDVELLNTHKNLTFTGCNGLMLTQIYIE